MAPYYTAIHVYKLDYWIDHSFFSSLCLSPFSLSLSFSSYFFSPCSAWFASSRLSLIASCSSSYSVGWLFACWLWLCDWPPWLAGGFWAGCWGILYWRLILMASASSGSSTSMPPIFPPPPPLMNISVPSSFSLRYTSPGSIKIRWLLSYCETVVINV